MRLEIDRLREEQVAAVPVTKPMTDKRLAELSGRYLADKAELYEELDECVEEIRRLRKENERLKKVEEVTK